MVECAKKKYCVKRSLHPNLPADPSCVFGAGTGRCRSRKGRSRTSCSVNPSTRRCVLHRLHSGLPISQDCTFDAGTGRCKKSRKRAALRKKRSRSRFSRLERARHEKVLARALEEIRRDPRKSPTWKVRQLPKGLRKLISSYVSTVPRGVLEYAARASAVPKHCTFDGKVKDLAGLPLYWRKKIRGWSVSGARFSAPGNETRYHPYGPRTFVNFVAWKKTGARVRAVYSREGASKGGRTTRWFDL